MCGEEFILTIPDGDGTATQVHTSYLVNAPHGCGNPLKVGFQVSRAGTGLAPYPGSVASQQGNCKQLSALRYWFEKGCFGQQVTEYTTVPCNTRVII